ncbi:radical SAM family heme chaperone HemW [Enterococcus timonensis]|uniref:radical SAM family heme chaperone HemW n=1 Tax=Enterococcus timonensis TaxID=1852364 RepID=UPI0008DAC687|nr:radical SAM family heme chaperone HemW [Enterococcus timonensis]
MEEKKIILSQSLIQPKISAYIHIPFCEHLCYYCDFNKFFLEGQPVDEYIQALLKEIRLAKQQQPFDVSTLYIGGGTPTALSAKQLDVLLAGLQKELPRDNAMEYTVEANPGDLTADKLAVLKNYGVNRLSLGVQTFDDRLLKKIGRKHSAQDVYDTLKLIDQAGFTNVSIDLIYALPGQSKENFQQTLDQAVALDLPHYSLYSLILENKTRFMNWVRQGRLAMPDDDLAADMFEMALTSLEKAGKMQYEISNFSVPGLESQHNLMYWNNEQYFGFGAGASGFLRDIRYRNFGPIPHYLNPIAENKLPILEKEKLTTKNHWEEEMFLGLRKKQGVFLQHFSKKFGVDYWSVYGDVTKKLINDKLLVLEDGWLKLTPRSLFIGNLVFEEFLLSE